MTPIIILVITNVRTLGNTLARALVITQAYPLATNLGTTLLLTQLLFCAFLKYLLKNVL